MPVKRETLVCAGLTAVVLAVYGQVVQHAFINYDDPDYVTANPYVRAGLTRAGVEWALTTVHASNWHPLTWLSHMIDCQLWGLRPGAHHLTSVVLHAINAMLVFALLNGTTGALWASAAVAWLFALHPLHVESVAWAAERKDVLSTLFGLLALIAYARYARRPVARRYLVVVAVFALSLMAKPMLVTLPLVMLLLDVWPLGRRPLPVLEKLPLLAVAAASSLVTFAVGLRGGAVATVDLVPFATRLGNVLVSYVRYLWKTIVPTDLVIFYPRTALSAWQVVGAATILVAVSAIVVWRGRERPWLAVGWVWYVVTLLPVIGLVQVGDQAMADRYTYFPLIGPFIMLAWSAREIARRSARAATAVAVVAAALLGACPVVTWFQVRHWRDSVALFTHATAVFPESYVGQVQLGNALAEEGRFSDAIARYALALRVKPDLPEAHGNLGALLAHEGRTDEAIPEFMEAIRLKPESADVHTNLAIVLAARGEYDLAIAHYAEALKLNPAHERARANLAAALAARDARGPGR
jgi:protein O-mannosyl-transferase